MQIFYMVHLLVNFWFSYFVILLNEDRLLNRTSNFVLYRFIMIRINYKILKISYAYLFCPYEKKVGRVIKKFSIHGHEYDGEGQIGEKIVDKHEII